MRTFHTLIWISSFVGFAFVFAFGAIVGSFLNVVIYRLPQGQGLVRPASACPACGTPLRWCDNIPILGWILLRGKCRYCKSRISPQYVLIELLIAVLFSGTYALWFMQPTFFPREWVQIMAPEWTFLGLRLMWPVFFLMLSLVAALIAITIIDARTFLIPLVIPGVITIAAFLVHPLNALMVEASGRSLGPPRTPEYWTLLLPSSGQLGAAFGGMAGLGLSFLLVWLRVMPRSFADYEQWEKDAAELRSNAQLAAEPPGPVRESVREIVLRTFLLTGPAIALMALGMVIGSRLDQPVLGIGIGIAVGLIIGWNLRKLVVGRRASEEPIWLQYPHARREMVKEAVFLAPCVVLGIVGFALTHRIGPLGSHASTAPLWVRALGGSVMGYLIGGGVVWIVRILGTVAFGKEAMGLGDVHLMAMVGAVMGWIDPFLAFFFAPFLGILWTVMSVVFGRLLHRRAGTALPFGPHLAMATLLVIYGKPAFEWALGWLLNNPNLNLP